MKKQLVILSLAVGSIMGIAGGCARHGMVKSEGADGQQTAAAKQKETAQSMNMQKSAGTFKVDPERVEPTNNKAEGTGSGLMEALDPLPNTAELKAVMHEIYFDFDTYALSPEARDILVKNAGLMKQTQSLNVRIEGHCDERGSDEYNLALGERRAKAAMKYMVTMGVSEKSLSIISYGKEKPVAAGHNEDVWAKNRRDEFVIVTD